MFDKFKHIKQKAEEVKHTLSQIEVSGSDANAYVKVTCNGNRQILALEINESIFKVRPKTEIENLTIEALNNALNKAEKIFIEETQKIMPKIPGLGS